MRPPALPEATAVQELWQKFEDMGGDIDTYPVKEFPHGFASVAAKELGFGNSSWKKLFTDPMFYPYIDEVKVDRAIHGQLPFEELTHYEFHVFAEQFCELDYGTVVARFKDGDYLLDYLGGKHTIIYKPEKGEPIEVRPKKWAKTSYAKPGTSPMKGLRGQGSVPDETIRAIRSEKAAGARNVDLADKYNLGRTHVGGIVAGRLYAHVA